MRTIGCLLVLSLLGCKSAAGDRQVSAEDQRAIAAHLEQMLRDAYDLSKPNVPERMLSLYPTSGRIVSATVGRVVTSRDTLETGIRYFWNNVGSNMRNPRWEWGTFYVDVLSPTAAVVTATYRVPHRTPRNEPHVIAGAMTEVFEKRDGRWVVIQEHLSDVPADDVDMTAMPDSMMSQMGHQ